MNKLLFVFAVSPLLLFADMQGLRKEVHFKLYEELTNKHAYGTAEYWISAGKAQAYSDIIVSIDLDLIKASYQ